MPVRNVLFVALDDCVSFEILNQFGVPLVAPVLDKIRARGTYFTRAYCEIAVCKPSRWAVMSGYSAFQTGIFDLNEDEFRTLRPAQLWPYRLKQAGFHNATMGKIYHGYVPIDAEYHNELYSHPPRAVGTWTPAASAPSIDYGGGYGSLGFTDPADEANFYDYRSAQDAINFLNGWTGDQPFYREVGFYHPHTKWDTPAWCKDAYDVNAIVTPSEWTGDFDVTEFARNFMLNTSSIEEFDDWWRACVRNQLSATTHVLHHLDRLLEALWASPHADDTMVVIYSDHGYHSGDRKSFHKFTMYEEAARAPLMIIVPGQTPRVVDQPVSMLDIGQTILDYTGQPLMDHCPGISLRPLIEGTASLARWVPTFWYGAASATDGDTRIIRYQDGSSELYDVSTVQHLTRPLPLTDARFAPALDGLLEACERRGLLLVEQGMAATPGAPWMSFIGEHRGGLPPDTNYAAIAPLTRYSEAPGYRRQIITPTAPTQAIDLPPDVDWVTIGANKTTQRITVTGHGDGDRRIILASQNITAANAVYEVNLEGGDNWINFQSAGRLVLRGGAGNDTLQAASSNADWIDLGPGDDVVVSAAQGNDTIFGGAGNDSIHGERSNDLIHGGPGDDTLLGGDGRDTLHLDAGADAATGGADADTFVIYRTEQVQTIMDLAAGDVIDLSRLAPLQPVLVTQVGADAEITAGNERIVCRNATVATVRAAIQGATHV